ncbi:VPA1262 family N-terminal domain-containing protein [Paraburkholderia fungorum]|uniref:VPA1262 family N-terminal domain-containing protein n=1 Tax=Paraburkholderia fungorum TaxID=134537 RepID=UPI0038782991
MPVDDLILAGDYNHAVVQVACLLDDKTAYLIFASAELLPAEMEKPPEEPSQHLRVKRFGDRAHIFFHRFIVSAEEAFSWYECCRNGTVTLLGKHAEWTLHCGELYQEPPWPSVIVGHQIPVFGDVSSPSRTHHLFPQSTPPELERLFEVQPDARPWISDRLLVDLLRYPELSGSVHLLLPNPVLRSAHVTLHTAKDGSEGSQIHLIARQGKTAHGMEVTLTEHRPTGICAVHRVIAQKPYFVIPHNARTEQVELIISCPERGILDWQQPFGFVREVNISGSLVGATKRVIIPGKNGENDHYDVPMKVPGWSSTKGDAVLAGGIPSRLRSNEFDRQRADEAERLGQKWFHGNHSEATTFIRDLIGKARKRVWIVDPYFATTEFFSFALATAYDDIDIVILTGGEELKKPDQIDAAREAGEVLLRQLESRKEMSHIKVRVMTGTPAVHDRFLVIDDQVWLTGNSLNSIGERAGMMISLPEPSVVVDKLNEVIHHAQRTKTLSEWVVNRTTGGES